MTEINYKIIQSLFVNIYRNISIDITTYIYNPWINLSGSVSDYQSVPGFASFISSSEHAIKRDVV